MALGYKSQSRFVYSLRGCEKSPLKVKRTLSGMKPGGVLFFVVKLSYYE